MIRALTVLASSFRGNGRPCERAHIAGVDALVARPEGGSGPVVLFANAATPRGIEQPAVGRLLGGLARAGFVAVAPELPNVRAGEVTPSTVDALVDVARSAGPRVALLGASTGAGLAILAAGDPRLADRVTAVLAIAPFASLERVLELATTGCYGDRPYPAAPLVAKATVRSLVASAPNDPGLPALLANRDPRRFDDLYGALDAQTRALVEQLSPTSRIGHVAACVELVSAPDDPFFPVEESRALARAARDARLTITPALEHVRPRLRPGLVLVAAALQRTLRRAAQAEPVPVLRPAAAL
jgi:alpha-beta hydrolase superfamily lysophospholipase